MQRTTKEQRRKARKHVREEKQRLRARAKKHRPRKWVIVHLTGLEVETITKLRAYAKEHKISVNNAINQILKKLMKEQENGI